MIFSAGFQAAPELSRDPIRHEEARWRRQPNAALHLLTRQEGEDEVRVRRGDEVRIG
jgi:hypothetical protein